MEALVQTRTVVWIAPMLMQIVATAVQADDPLPAVPKFKPTKMDRPRAIPLRRAEVDPHLENILSEWERAASGIQRLDCSFTRFRYDNTFEVERRGTGWLSLDLK